MMHPSRSFLGLCGAALACGVAAGLAARPGQPTPGVPAPSTPGARPEALAHAARPERPERPPSILVFTKTAGYRHASIPAGVDAIRALGDEHGWQVTHTEDAADFTDQSLLRFDAVVFLSTTGDVLDEDQQAAFERYIGLGRGFAGIHAAADTEYDWAWYGQLLGAYFKSHPSIQDAVVVIEDFEHPSTSHLGEQWPRRDEWYDFQTNPRTHLPSGEPVDPEDPEAPRILATMLAGSYQGSTMGDDHPIAWFHEYAGGRAWYTAGGHTTESFAEPEFLRHLAGGIGWAMGTYQDDQ
jgi:type 1 glutamine amidotransferase